MGLRDDIMGTVVGLRLIRQHRQNFQRWPHVLRPRTFNERVIHRALFDRDPTLRVMSDKIAARELIARRVGDRYVVPLLGRWTDPRSIDFEALPPSIVFKPRASSGQVLTLEEGLPFVRSKVVRGMAGWVGPAARRRMIRLEWGYHGVPHEIIAEPLLLGPQGGPAVDLDVYVFRGKAALLRTLAGRKHSKQRRDAWFDRQGRQVEIGTTLTSSRQSLAPEIIAEAIEVSEAVAGQSDMLRVDLYITGDGLKVGELTPYSWAGQAKWRNPDHDELLGRWWGEGADTAQLADFAEPTPLESISRPVSPTERAGRWLQRFENCVRNQDFEGARPLFAPDVLAFGSLTAEIAGLDQLESEQWRPVWSATRDFRFVSPRVVAQDQDIVAVVSGWQLEGRRPDGSLLPRRGRCTLVLQPGQTSMVCVHSHFSMEPTTRDVIAPSS